MRIIAGVAGGRRLISPRGLHTRPATGRLREALFSSLGALVEGARVVDLYAGTGSFGLEALSRGAASATFVERDPAALRALRANVERVGLGGEVVPAPVDDALRADFGRYDIAFVDPPYALESSALAAVLALLEPLLDHGAIVIVHRRRDQGVEAAGGTLLLTGSRRYGDAEVWWYTKEEQ